MDYLNIVGTIAATLTTLSFFPQVAKVVKTRSTHDLSLGMFVLFLVGISLWLVYGIMLHSVPMIVGNTITIIFASIILVYKLKFK